jgi:hypothetical protein
VFAGFADSGFSGTVLVAFGDHVILEKGYGLARSGKPHSDYGGNPLQRRWDHQALHRGAVLTLQVRGPLSVDDPIIEMDGRTLPDEKGTDHTAPAAHPHRRAHPPKRPGIS